MAKIGLRDHRKFRKLIVILDMPGPHVLGHLEYFWSRAYADKVHTFDREEVEIDAVWHGKGCEKDAFVDALIACKFLDVLEGGRLKIHNYEEHSPAFVKEAARKRKQRERARKSQDTGGNVTGQSRDSHGTEEGLSRDGAKSHVTSSHAKPRKDKPRKAKSHVADGGAHATSVSETIKGVTAKTQGSGRAPSVLDDFLDQLSVLIPETAQNGAQGKWRLWIQEMIMMPGGDDALQILLDELRISMDPILRESKGVSEKDDPPAWLNGMRIKWMEARVKG